MYVSTAWTAVLSQSQNGEPTVWLSSWKTYPCCASHWRFAWHILCMYFWSFVRFLGRHCADTFLIFNSWEIMWLTHFFTYSSLLCDYSDGHTLTFHDSLTDLCNFLLCGRCLWRYQPLLIFRAFPCLIFGNPQLHMMVHRRASSATLSWISLPDIPLFSDLQDNSCVLNYLHLWISRHVVYCHSRWKGKGHWKIETQLEIKTKIQPNYIAPS